MNRASKFHLVLLAILAAGRVGAETLRVTSWNLDIASQTTDSELAIQRAAATLNSLDSDVILLQGIEDWRMCEQLASRLTSADYRVLICSAFPAKESDRAQVAILSKRKAYFTWTETWQTDKQQPLPRGVAFAALQFNTQNLGFFTGLSGNQRNADALPRRVLAEMEAIKQWDTNKVQTFVVGASFDAGGRQSVKGLRRSVVAFEKAGLVNSTEELPDELKSTVNSAPGSLEERDCLFSGPLGVPANTRIESTKFFTHYPITCDLELDPDKVSLALDIRAEKRHEKQAKAEETVKEVAYWTGGILAGVVFITLIIRRRSGRRPIPKSHVPPPSDPPIRVEVKPAPSPGPVRPIIFAESPAKRAPGPLRVRPVLRLQKPNQAQEPPTTPAPRPPPLPPLQLKVEHPAEPEEDQDYGIPPGAGLPSVEKSEVRRGVVKDLTAWLKHKLVRRLVDDRAQLLEAQKLATRMATTLDTRLARIEAQIQQQNQAYIQRIEELNRELAAAREENRELIRERIAQVKAEMEAARARVLAEANLDNTSLRL